MIVTLTANPSLDRTVELDGALEPGAVQRAVSTRQDPGGKGVNVTRALLASGVDSVAVLPAASSDPILVALDVEGVPYRAVPIDGAVRTNLTIVDASGVTTKVNEPGPALDAAAQSRLIDVTAEAALGADWLVLAGSLPPGVGDDFYVRVVAAVRAAAEHAGSTAPRIAADTSGAALTALVELGVGIDLIKPNAEELAELTGSSDEAALEAGPDEAIALARSLPVERVRASLVTLGAVGAALVTEDQAWLARAPRVVPRSTVGAGDCSLAGFLVAAVEGASPVDALARAVASGAAAVALPGSAVPTRDQVDPARVTVTEVAGLPVGDRQ